MNVVENIRVSTQGQAKEGYSLIYQEVEIKAYCKENVWNLIHIFRDEAISGAKLNEEALEIDRVGLQEMLAHLSSVKIIRWWCSIQVDYGGQIWLRYLYNES